MKERNPSYGMMDGFKHLRRLTRGKIKKKNIFLFIFYLIFITTIFVIQFAVIFSPKAKVYMQKPILFPIAYQNSKQNNFKSMLMLANNFNVYYNINTDS